MAYSNKVIEHFEKREKDNKNKKEVEITTADLLEFF